MIFFFSGTGNTRWAAEKLASATCERLLFIPDELKGDCRYTLDEGERIGFCFPVHGWQPPAIVRQFIRRMEVTLVGEHYCYALITCGDSIGRAMEILNKELKPKGLSLDSRFSIVMPESYVCLPFMYTDKPEREKAKIAKARDEMEEYCQMVSSCLKGEVHTRRGITPWTFSHIIGVYFNRHMVSDRKFTVADDLCIHCGKCQKVCPTGDVILTEKGTPQWQHNGTCTCCLACYHHCPRHAINYGAITRKRGQYYYGHNTEGHEAGLEHEKDSISKEK